MFRRHRTRDILHRLFGSAEEKSRGTAVNTMFAAHIYENWERSPSDNDPLKWFEFVARGDRA